MGGGNLQVRDCMESCRVPLPPFPLRWSTSYPKDTNKISELNSHSEPHGKPQYWRAPECGQIAASQCSPSSLTNRYQNSVPKHSTGCQKQSGPENQLFQQRLRRRRGVPLNMMILYMGEWVWGQGACLLAVKEGLTFVESFVWIHSPGLWCWTWNTQLDFPVNIIQEDSCRQASNTDFIHLLPDSWTVAPCMLGWDQLLKECWLYALTTNKTMSKPECLPCLSLFPLPLSSFPLLSPLSLPFSFPFSLKELMESCMGYDNFEILDIH